MTDHEQTSPEHDPDDLCWCGEVYSDHMYGAACSLATCGCVQFGPADETVGDA